MPDADPNASTSTARPKLGRPESELLMSYYQSSLADQGISYQPPPQQNRRAAHRRTLSGNSTSSSDYSSSSDHSLDQPKPAEATRRSSVPTQGGSDRRRLAIVEMDTVREAESPTADSAIRSRRQFESRLAGLALIAPPDASPNSYAYHAPPTSAPPTALHHPEEKGHHRSASEVTTASSKNRASRDVGIVGTTTKPLIIEPLKRPRLETVPTNESILPPVFQEPHSSRAPTPNTAPSPSLSPIVTSQLTPSVKRRSTDLSVHTPEIGQGKEIHVPVASPVVVDLGPDASLRVGNSTFERRASPALQVVEPRSAFPAQVPSSYLHYQPGLHATAGPLPPPPRAVNINPSAPPPPRPPRLHSPPPRRRRDLDAAKQGLPSVSAVLGSSTPSSSNSSRADLTNSSTSSHGHGDSGTEESQHRREGAFSPSIISTTSSTSPSDSPTTPMRTIDALIPKVNASGSNGADAGSGGPSNVVISPPPRLESLPEQKPNDDWTYVSRDLNASPSSDGHVSQDRVSWDSTSARGITPSPPPKGIRSSLTANLKRFSSLPRTPSPSNKSLARSSSSRSRSSYARTPSPVPVAPSMAIPPPRRPKIISMYPSALQCTEVATRKNAQERCALYAQKINELYVHDCGLGEWVLQARFRGANPPGKRATVSSVPPSSFTPKARHVSRSSMKSEASFPRRADAGLATDLTTKPADLMPVVPTVPYPALSPRSLAVPLPASSRTLVSSPNSKTGNFFSSLGRKASMSKKERPNPLAFTSSSSSSSSGGARLTKSPPTPTARPVLISNTTPSVPGGPRAAPNRALRAQSIMASPFSSNSSMASDRSARRPSLFTPPSSASSDREYERQVDKLADLLPQADRDVLAGYLRRAGQDILAIGQYLEDEKNGTIRRD